MAERQRSKPKDQRVLALDIGSRFIKIADLRLARGQISLSNIVVAPTPPETVDEGQILDATMLGREIKRLLRENKITTRHVIASVRGQSSVVVRPIELPRMSKKELADTMKFEVERHIPFAADEIVMDYAPFVDPDTLPETEENMQVLLAVAQEDLINSYIAVIRAAKLAPVAFDVEILAAIRSLIEVHAESRPAQTLALINIGASSTDISIIQGGNLVFNRSIRLAGERLTSAIAEQLGRSMEEAEEIKKEHAQVFLDAFAGELPVPLETDDAPLHTAGTTEIADAAIPDMGESSQRPVFTFDNDETFSATPVAEEEADSIPRFIVDEDDSASPRPVFSLDEETEEAVVAPIEEAQTAQPVFDLSSELEEQLPPPRVRPASLAEDDAAGDMSQSPKTVPDYGTPGDTPLVGGGAAPFSEMPGAPRAADWTQTGGSSDPFKRRVFEAIQPALEELITEIRRSLEYFSNREPDAPVDRVLLYGGTSRLPRLAEYIRHEVGLEVAFADPLDGIDTSPCQLPAEYLQDLAPVLPICIGLGIRDMIE